MQPAKCGRQSDHRERGRRGTIDTIPAPPYPRLDEFVV
jgi:hypothetical protein